MPSSIPGNAINPCPPVDAMETPVQRVFTPSGPADMDRVAAGVLDLLGTPRVVALTWPLGAGKTTLVKALCRQLGVVDGTASPSFAILLEYALPDGRPVYHFDFYRIESESEAYDLGYENYFFSGAWCFVEWADKVRDLLPAGHAEIRIGVDDRQRTITVTP